MRGNPKFWMLLAALAAFALYLPTLGYDFAYDSVTQVREDDFIHQPGNFADVLSLRVLSRDVLDFNRPVNLLTLMLDALLWGRNPAGFRLTNLLLHAAAAALLFRWLRIMTGDLRASLLATLCFAAHPLHCETVVEDGYREDLLATVFLLAGLNAAASFQPGTTGKTWGPALLTAGSLFLAAASKESGIAGPVVLAVFWTLFRRDQAQTRRAWLLLWGACTALVGAFLAFRFALEPKHSLIFDTPPARIAAPGMDWLLVQSRIWTGELLRVIWPVNLCADYGPYNLRNLNPMAALIGVLALGAAAATLSCWNRKIALGCALFVAAMLPVSNLLPIYRPMADRYLYLPMTGLALLLACALASLKPGAVRRLALGATVLAAVALTASTLHQQPVWKTEASLWRATAQQNPGSYNAWLGCGYAALDANTPAQAITHFQHASALAGGRSAEPFAAIALAEKARGRSREAAEALAHASKLDSRYARPETLVRALVFPAWRARQLDQIARDAGVF